MTDAVAAPAEETKAAPVEAPKAAPAAAETAAPASKPSAEEVSAGDGAIDPNKSYTQADLDRIVAKVKKNERYRTKKEVEAFYQGRESVAKPAEPAKAAEPAAEDKPPVRDQFTSYEEFLDAKAAFTGRRAAQEFRAKADAEAKEQQRATEAAERVKTFQGKVNEKYPDLAERAEAIANIQMPPGMGDAIAESDLGPDLLNHFADNPKDFERIAALSPSAAIREVGKLEARLEGTAQKPAPAAVPAAQKPSAAPAPIAPVGGSAVVGSEDLASLVNDPARFKAVRDKQALRFRAGGSPK